MRNKRLQWLPKFAIIRLRSCVRSTHKPAHKRAFRVPGTRMNLLVDTTISRVVYRGPEYLLHRFRRQYQKENPEHQLMIPGTAKDGCSEPRYYPDLASPEYMFTALYDGRAALRADYAEDIAALQHYERDAE